MRRNKALVALLTVAMVMSLSGTASAQSGGATDDVKSRLAAAERYDEYTVETPSDSKLCTQYRGYYATQLTRRDRINKKFVRDLARQINRHGSDEIRVQVELLDDMGLIEAHEAVGAEVVIRGIGYSYDDSSTTITDSGTTPEEHLVSIQERMQGSIDALEVHIASQEVNLEKLKARGEDTESEERDLEQLRETLAAMKRSLDELTLEGAQVRGLELEGSPAAILAVVESGSVFSGSVRNDPHKVPSVVRRVAKDRDLSRADAVVWLKKNVRVGNRLITRSMMRPDNAVQTIVETCG